MTRGEKIRHARLKAKLTQPQLARLVGASHAAVGQWERDEVTDIAYKYLRPLCYNLGLDINELDNGKQSQHQTGDSDDGPYKPQNQYIAAAADALQQLDSDEITLVVDFIKLLRKSRNLSRRNDQADQ